MVKRINSLLKKCKSFSAKLGRSSSYTSLRSRSTKEDWWCEPPEVADENSGGDGDEVVVYVGSSRRRYMISAKHLSHPVMTALINRPLESNSDHDRISVKCEVVLFDHLLWMLKNGELEVAASDDGSLEEMAALYES